MKSTATPKLTIINPVFNGGPWIDRWFAAVSKQEFDGTFDILIADSGSIDDSVQLIKQNIERYPKLDIEFIQFPNSEYQHGSSRNMLAKMARSPRILFAVQDAIPLDNKWMQNMYDALDIHENVAAAYGRHVGNPDSNIVKKRLIEETFVESLSLMRSQPTYLSANGTHTFTSKEDGENWVAKSAFSNVNAIYKREILMDIKFRDVDYSEDRFFAMDAIDRGYLIAYTESGAVSHSHDYTIVNTMKRTFDEWEGIEKTGGYPYKFSLLSVIRQVCTGYLRDLHYAFTARDLRITERLIAPFTALPMEIAVKLGMYFGLRHGKLSPRLKSKLSQQYSWRASSNNEDN